MLTNQTKSWLHSLKYFVSFSPKTFSRSRIVYVIYSIHTSFYYIGSTKRHLLIRFQNHIRNAKNSQYKKIGKLKLYKFLRKFGLHKWSIAIFKNNTSDFRNLEKHFITLLYPKLNTNFSPKLLLNQRYQPNLIPYTNLKRILTHSHNHLNLFTSFSINKKMFCHLLQAFRYSSFQKVKMIKTTGMFSCTNWKRIKTNFILQGSILSKQINTSFYDTSTIQNICNNSKHISFIISFTSIHKVLYLKPDKLIHKLINAKKNLNDIVDVLLDKEIWKLFKYINSFTTISRYNQMAAYRLRYVLKRKFSFFLPKRITLKVIYTPTYSKNSIKQIFFSHIKRFNSNQLFMNLIKNKTKVVFKKRKNIAKMLHNHIQFAKDINQFENKCKCPSCDFKNISIYSDNHTPINSNFVIKLNNVSETFAIMSAINKVLPRINILNEIQVSHIPQPSNPNFSFVNKYHSDIYKKVENEKSLHINRVISPLDKNIGATISFCPTIFRQSILKIFDWKEKDAHYNLIKESKPDILTSWKQLYHNCEAAMSLGKFNFSGDLPYAYAIPKDKDKTRFRPIVSYCNHPLKWIYNRAARAIFFLLLEAHIGNMLIKCNDLVSVIEKFTQGNTYELFLTTFDIKDMYTNLKHDEILKHVTWLIEFIIKKSRRKMVCINKFGKTGVSWGRSYNPKNSVHIHIAKLIEIVKLDIKHCYFSLGVFILQQIYGIPMGSPLSAVLAILCCTIAEYKWNKSLKHSQDFHHIFLTRYVDDGLIIIKALHDNKVKRDAMIKHLFSKYPKTLRILIEQQGKEVHFLENYVTVNNTDIVISHYNKNTKHILKNELKIQNLIDYYSFAPKIQKLSIVIGTLFRIRKISNNVFKTIEDIFNIIVEFTYLNYPHKVICKALTHLSTKTSDPIWSLILLGMIMFK